MFKDNGVFYDLNDMEKTVMQSISDESNKVLNTLVYVFQIVWKCGQHDWRLLQCIQYPGIYLQRTEDNNTVHLHHMFNKICSLIEEGIFENTYNTYKSSHLMFKRQYLLLLEFICARRKGSKKLFHW